MSSLIRKLREEEKLSITKLAQRAGVNPSALCWAELGKVAPGKAFRASLAAFYGKPEEMLFHPSGFAK